MAFSFSSLASFFVIIVINEIVGAFIFQKNNINFSVTTDLQNDGSFRFENVYFYFLCFSGTLIL